MSKEPDNQECSRGGNDCRPVDRLSVIPFLEDQLPRGAVGGMRVIQPGDEALLTHSEAAAIDRAVLPVRRASGAARHLARMLCTRIGVNAMDIPRHATGAPVWPTGVTGSLAHDATIAVAIVAKSIDLKGLGIDIEPRAVLEEEVARLVAGESERQQFNYDPAGDKALFCIKEAVFKAVHPHDNVFLDFTDVIVERTTCTAETFYGRIVNWRVVTKPHVVAIAWWS